MRQTKHRLAHPQPPTAASVWFIRSALKEQLLSFCGDQNQVMLNMTLFHFYPSVLHTVIKEHITVA